MLKYLQSRYRNNLIKNENVNIDCSGEVKKHILQIPSYGIATLNRFFWSGDYMQLAAVLLNCPRFNNLHLHAVNYYNQAEPYSYGSDRS